MILVLLYSELKSALSRQVKKITVDQSKVLKHQTIPFWGGHPPMTNGMVNPENDSP